MLSNERIFLIAFLNNCSVSPIYWFFAVCWHLVFNLSQDQNPGVLETTGCYLLSVVWGSGESAAGYQWNLHHLNEFLLCAHADTFPSQDGLPLQAGSSGFTHLFGACFKCTEMKDCSSFWRAEPAMLSYLIYWHLLIWVMLIGLAPHILPSSDCHVFLYTFSPSCPYVLLD